MLTPPIDHDPAGPPDPDREPIVGPFIRRIGSVALNGVVSLGHIVAEGAHTGVELGTNAVSVGVNNITANRLLLKEHRQQHAEERIPVLEADAEVYERAGQEILDKTQPRATEADYYNPLAKWGVHVNARPKHSVPKYTGKASEAYPISAPSVTPRARTLIQDRAALRAGFRSNSMGKLSGYVHDLHEIHGDIVMPGHEQELKDYLKSGRLTRADQKELRAADRVINGKKIGPIHITHGLERSVHRLDHRITKSAAGNDIPGRLIRRRINRNNNRVARYDQQITELEDKIEDRRTAQQRRIDTRHDRREDHRAARRLRRAFSP